MLELKIERQNCPAFQSDVGVAFSRLEFVLICGRHCGRLESRISSLRQRSLHISILGNYNGHGNGPMDVVFDGFWWVFSGYSLGDLYNDLVLRNGSRT